MDVRQCKMCGRLYQFIRTRYCIDCADKIDRMFIQVRDYLYKHPRADIQEIAERTKVPERSVLDFLREERLVIDMREGSGSLKCEQCGKAIGSGRYCSGCQQELGKAMASQLPQSTPDPMKKKPSGSTNKSRMHLNYK